VPWSNERPLENKELNAIIGAWFTLCSGDDVAIDATSLSTKSPTIVDYKIHKEWRKIFFYIFRADAANIVEISSFGVTDTPPESTSLNGGLRYESMFPSICDDVVAMEYAHTALVCAVDSQYSNTSNTNGLALTSASKADVCSESNLPSVCDDVFLVVIGDEFQTSYVINNASNGLLNVTRKM
nr:ulp1 protease family, C-terminal catalytic domain-containing protein [Tanacetum cinerariifolium]